MSAFFSPLEPSVPTLKTCKLQLHESLNGYLKLYLRAIVIDSDLPVLICVLPGK